MLRRLLRRPPQGPPSDVSTASRAARGDARPFSLAGKPDGRGVLLIHGFTGSPFEMHLLGQFLHQQGLTCVAPLLAGHDAGVAALAQTRWQDWLGSAEQALLELHHTLRQHGPQRLAVVGLSMGGLLTLELCRRHPDLIHAAAILATPIRLRRLYMRAIRAIARSPFRALTLPKLVGSDVRDRQMRRSNPATAGLPLPALGSLLDLMDHVRPHLPQVRTPLLLAHGVQDHTVPVACLGEIAGALGTPPADLRRLLQQQSYHLLPLDVEKDVLFSAVLDHISRYLTPSA